MTALVNNFTLGNPRWRYCCICGKQLEPKVKYVVLAEGGRDKYRGRQWFCEKDGRQVRAAVRALTGASVV